MILSVIDSIYQFFKYKLLPGEQPEELKLPKWVNVSKEVFNEILSIITKVKNNRLKSNVDGKEITLDNAESLLKGIASEKIIRYQFKKECNNIAGDVEVIVQKSMTSRCQEKMIEILSMLTEIPKSKDKKPDKQPDTTDMPELESEESAEKKKSKEDKD